MEDRVEIIKDFVRYAQQELAIEHLPKIQLVTDRSFATTNHSFGAYKPENQDINVYVANRNMADILRTLAHELVHHRQNELGMQMDGATGSEIENQANSLAGVLLRNYGQQNELIYEGKIDKKDPAKYQIYCDMDGVLCDFDKQFKENFGVGIEKFKNSVENSKRYKNLSKEEKKNKVNQVLEKIIGEKGEKFWDEMPWMPEGKKLWDKIKDHHPIIVTSPGKFKGAVEGKKAWIKKNLEPEPPVKFEQAGEKQNVLEGKSEEEIAKSVLIDDYDKNIDAWKAAGGKTIKEKPSKPAHNHLD